MRDYKKICVEDLLNILHNELFEFTYKYIEYTNKRVRKIIEYSIINITNNITGTIDSKI